MKWEYKLVQLSLTIKGYEDRLNAFGELGWEFVTTKHSGYVLFKRPWRPEYNTDETYNKILLSMSQRGRTSVKKIINNMEDGKEDFKSLQRINMDILDKTMDIGVKTKKEIVTIFKLNGITL